MFALSHVTAVGTSFNTGEEIAFGPSYGAAVVPHDTLSKRRTRAAAKNIREQAAALFLLLASRHSAPAWFRMRPRQLVGTERKTESWQCARGAVVSG